MARFNLIASGTAIVFGAAILSAGIGSGEAATVSSTGVSMLPEAGKAESMVTKVQHPPRPEGYKPRPDYESRKHDYDPKKHGPRTEHRTDRNRYPYHGFWYTIPFWLYSFPQYDYWDEHVRWCLNRFRSYNPETDMYLGYDGRHHRCRSPYRP